MNVCLLNMSVLFVVWVSRVWCAGVIHLPAKMEAPVGSRALHSHVSVQVAGLESTAMCPASAVRLPLSSKVTRRGKKLCVCSISICVPSTIRLSNMHPPPFSQGFLWQLCAVTEGSVWMQAAHTCAGARQATWAATARSRWMSVCLTHVTMVQPAQITWADTPVRYENKHILLGA